MGGPGSGGRRKGAGRKPKSEAERALAGNAGHRHKVVVQHPSSQALPAALPKASVSEEDAPNDLTLDERHVWLELAPKAMDAGTLTDETREYFKLFCRTVCLEKRYAASLVDAGGPNHRGLIQRCQAMYKDFDLAPFGKAKLGGGKPAAPPVDPLKEKYFGGGRNGA